MGKNGLGQIYAIASRSCLYFHNFGQSHKTNAGFVNEPVIILIITVSTAPVQ